MSLLVAIHQPNVFPWLGFFDKLARADLFVVLDHVQFPKKGGSWGNRVQFLVAQQPRFVTVPIRRDVHGVRRTCEVKTSPQSDWRGDIIKTLQTNYGRAPHFREVFAVAEPLIRNPEATLAEYNLNGIRTLARHLRIDVGKIVRSSTLPVEGVRTDLLIDILRAVGGERYLNGGGSAGYLEPEKFAANGIELVQQAFQHPVYAQVGSKAFVPGLSCLDALFHCGFDTVAAWFACAAPTSGGMSKAA